VRSPMRPVALLVVGLLALSACQSSASESPDGSEGPGSSAAPSGDALSGAIQISGSSTVEPIRTVAPPSAGTGIRAAADPARLSQALLNLAHNAVKYSHRGGEIRLGWDPTNAGVRFWVADDGVGIPLTHRDRIFERFYKVDRARARADRDEGPRDLGGASAGLGLAIVRHIGEAHGGSVGVESEEGVGSTFWIEVPQAR
jgi:signal transduction histidine kinase